MRVRAEGQLRAYVGFKKKRETMIIIKGRPSRLEEVRAVEMIADKFAKLFGDTNYTYNQRVAKSLTSGLSHHCSDFFTCFDVLAT